MKKKNGEIELFRFVFSTFIVLNHFNNAFDNFKFFPKGYIGVEFFFLISGFLMAMSGEKHAGIDRNIIPSETYQFLKRKISNFYGYFFVSWLLLVLYVIIVERQSIAYIVKGLISVVPNLTLTRQAGFALPNESLALTGDWYLSVMILASLILYPIMLLSYKWSIRIIFPILGLFGLGLIQTQYETLIVVHQAETFILLGGMWRGLCEMALGAWGYAMVQIIKKYDFTKLSIVGLTIVKYSCMVPIILYIFLHSSDSYSIVMLIFCLGFVMLSFSGKTYGIQGNYLILFLGKFSLPVFVSHGLLRRVGLFLWGNEAKFCQVILLVVLSYVVAFGVMMISDFVQGVLKKHRHLFIK